MRKLSRSSPANRYEPRRASEFGKFATWKSAAILLLSAATTIASRAQNFTTLTNLTGANGAHPAHLSLVQGRDGDLYGTTTSGGAHGNGTVFKVSPAGTLTTLYSFCSLASCADGSGPDAGLVQASDGNFYGTTGNGGQHSNGTVFKITPRGAFTTLYNFCSVINAGGQCVDGANPHAALLQAANGMFYGTTFLGGANGDGAVFQITSTGKLTTLHSFDVTDGQNPGGGLFQASNGIFYGTTEAGGTAGNGTVYAMTAAGKLTTLHSFNGTDGSGPLGWLILGSSGSFYGTTAGGGANSRGGTVFQITAAGKLTTLYSFCSLPSCADGLAADAGLIQATDGNFYGMTNLGGNCTFCGTIYKLTPAGKLTTLHFFDVTDGANPAGGLVEDTNGDVYGTAGRGGTDDFGTVFRLGLGFKPFIALQSASGVVGSAVGIFGQGFDSASVVKFNGVEATKVTLTGTTYLVAIVPAGASSGFVTVTTGATTLTSKQRYVVHN